MDQINETLKKEKLYGPVISLSITERLVDLVTLYLSSAGIETLDKKTFQGLKNLKELYLFSNQLIDLKN